MPTDIHRLINDAQSSVDGIRKAAEASLLQLCDENASEIFVALINVTTNVNEELSSRQFALFALRKLITMYWSPGFESYRATSMINESAKTLVRESLLQISLRDSELSKLRNGASYCVVQICAVDFPDQWPDLLKKVYDAILSKSLSAMSLLNEIYDDIVSEEIFFEGGIGVETIDVTFQILRDPNTSYQTLSVALNLFHSCLLQLLTVSSSSTEKRKEVAIQSTNEVLKIWGNFLQYQSVTKNPECIMIKSRIYEGLALLKSEFPRKLFPEDFCGPFKELALNDLEEAAEFYIPLSNGHVDEKQLEMINEYSVHLLEFLTSICGSTFEMNDLQRIIVSLECLCCYNDNIVEDWGSDFNSFVSNEAGLAASFTIRDQAVELLSALDDESFLIASKCIMQELSNLTERNTSWKYQESLFFLLQSIVANDSMPSVELGQEMLGVLSFLSSVLDWAESNDFVQSRAILVIPKLLEKYMDFLDNVKALTGGLFTQSLNLALSSANEMIKASILIAFTYYAYFAELPSVLGHDVCQQVQTKTLKLIHQVCQESEDDTDGLLLEVLGHVIDCNATDSDNSYIVESELHLILAISAKEPSNIQSVVESQTCLDKLLKNLDTKNYAKYAEECLPSFLKVMEGSKNTEYSYSPILSLILQFLDVFMNRRPTDGKLPPSISNFVFQPLKDILFRSIDDEILQLATSAFSHLVYNTDASVLAPHLQEVVHILDKLLSFDVSDTAAQHSGSLIVTIFTRFPNEIQGMVPVILKAVTGKLIQAKNMATSQNLLFVFCYLTCVDAQQTVDFLSAMNIEQRDKSALSLIIEKWLDSFQEIRGETRAKENVLALSKLFFLNDARLAEMRVNGDIIPYQGNQIITRSKAKQMPDKFTEVPFYTKVVKLFVAELSCQDRQDPTKYTQANISNDGSPERENEDDTVNDDDWEDVEDVLDYETLQEYVEESDVDDGEIDDETYEEIVGTYDLKRSMREMLLDFFKEVTARNTNGFHDIYNCLTQEEKRILSENLV